MPAIGRGGLKGALQGSTGRGHHRLHRRRIACSTMTTSRKYSAGSQVSLGTQSKQPPSETHRVVVVVEVMRTEKHQQPVSSLSDWLAVHLLWLFLVLFLFHQHHCVQNTRNPHPPGTCILEIKQTVCTMCNIKNLNQN